MAGSKLSPRQVRRLEVQWEALESLPDHPQIVCDLGVEGGLSGEQLRRRWPDAFVDGVDLWPGVNTEPYDRVVQDDAINWLLGSSYEFVICAELIEHYDREQGLELLTELERQPRALLTTPTGFMPQGEIEGNPYQVHRSGWVASDFTSRGWRLLLDDPALRLLVVAWGF